jgi:HSP20 family protein
MVFQELTPWLKTKSMVRPQQDDFTLNALQRRMNRMFDDFFGDFGRGGLEAVSRFMPQIEITDTDQQIRVTAELAGLDEKDVEITLHDDVLTIKGEKKQQREEKNERRFLSERSYGAFSRSIALPDNVQQDKIEAAFQKGVLTVTLPKAEPEESKAKKIEIKTA